MPGAAASGSEIIISIAQEKGLVSGFFMYESSLELGPTLLCGLGLEQK